MLGSMVLLLLPTLSPQNPAGPERAATPDRAALWRQDIDTATVELAKRHKNLFAKMTEEEWAASAARAKRALGAQPTTATFAAAMLRHVARIGDGHTTFGWQQIGLPQVPIKLAEFAEGIFVYGDGTAEQKLLGLRVTHLDGRPLADCWKELAPFIGHENEHLLRMRGLQHMVVPALLHAEGIGKNPKALQMRGRTSRGEERTVTVEALPSAALRAATFRYAFTELPLCLRQPRAGSWFRYLPEKKALYLKYNRCDDARGFQATLKAMWAAAEGKPVERFLLDVRHNGGGNELIITPLIADLQRRRALLRSGLFVLIGRGTFSSAMNNAITLRDRYKAVLIGRATAGKPNHFGEVKSMRLPQSRLTVRYSSNYFRKVKGDPVALVPDIEVKIPAAAFFAGRDPVLEAACAAPLRHQKK